MLQGKQLADRSVAGGKLQLQTVTDAEVASSVLVADGSHPLTADWNVGTKKLTGLADPINPQDAATRNYVDSAIQGLDVKASCRLATAAPLPANTRTGNVLTASVNGSINDTGIDGVTTIALNDRILVKSEATQANNGLYYVSALGDAGNPWALTRTTDADTSAKVTAGLFTFVEEGSSLAESGWVLVQDQPIILNTTALPFSQFSGAGTIVAGNGLVKTGNTIDLVINASSTGGLTANPDDLQVNYAAVGDLAAADASAASAGVGGKLPRADHKHAVSTGTPGAIAIGDSADAGTSANLARADHRHSLAAPAAPADVTKAAASAGTSSSPARADHKHDVSTATPASGAVAVNNSAAEGTATSLSRSDHQHAVATGTPSNVGTSNAAGTSTSFPRLDHQHAVPVVTKANKNMTASATASDGDPATANTVTNSNALGGYVGVRVNGVSYNVGDGTKVAVDCYFSGDGGVTARAMSAIVAGDGLYWNGSVAGFQLAVTDRLDLSMDSF